MRNRTKAIAVAAITVTLAGGSTAAAAAATSGSSTAGTPAKLVVTSSKVAGSRQAGDATLAARLGVSSARLDQALRSVKTALSRAKSNPTQEEFYAALARELGIPLSRVRQAFPKEQASSKRADDKHARDKGVYDKRADSAKRAHAQRSEQQDHDQLAAAVARELHVSTARVEAAFRPLFAAGRAEVSAPKFVAAARALGASPEQLNAAVIHAKQSLGGGK